MVSSHGVLDVFAPDIDNTEDLQIVMITGLDDWVRPMQWASPLVWLLHGGHAQVGARANGKCLCQQTSLLGTAPSAKKTLSHV